MKNDEDADADFFAEEKKSKDPSMQKVSSVEGKKDDGVADPLKKKIGKLELCRRLKTPKREEQEEAPKTKKCTAS